MAAAMAASLEANPEAGPSKCKLCLGDPHPVEDCPLVNRLATGAEEKPEMEEKAKKEEKGQQVKDAKQEGKKGAGKEKSPQGKTAPAGRVIGVCRGFPVNR